MASTDSDNRDRDDGNMPPPTATASVAIPVVVQVDHENEMQQPEQASDSEPTPQDNVSTAALEADLEASAPNEEEVRDMGNGNDNGNGPAQTDDLQATAPRVNSNSSSMATAPLDQSDVLDAAAVPSQEDPPIISMPKPKPRSRRASASSSRRASAASRASSGHRSSGSSAAHRLSSLILRRFSSTHGSMRGSDEDLAQYSPNNTNENNNEGNNSSPGSTPPTSGNIAKRFNMSRGQSKRGSMSIAYTWTQLARRRSTDIADARRPSNISSEVDAVDGEEGDAAAAKKSIIPNCKDCYHSAQDSLTTRYHSLCRSTTKALKYPRSIVLPTFLTFAILTSAGLFAIFHSSHQYHESNSLQLLEESRELAYELDDILSGALLPLFTLQEMAGQFEEFQQLHPKVVERETYFKDGGRAFRNVTDLCVEESVLGLYRRAAESIVQSSKMGNILLNVQLQPAGTVCLNHPHYTTYEDKVIMDHTKAIGLDRIHDKFQSKSARASITKNEVGTTGPIVLIQDHNQDDPHETLIYWTPIFASREEEGTLFELETLDGVKVENYWGFAGVLLDWDEIVKKVNLYEFFEERDMKFALVEVMGEGTSGDKVVEASITNDENEPSLTRETAREALKLQARENWYLLLDVPPQSPGDPGWAIWGSILVILGSFLVSLALMLVLVSRKDHEELLCRCIPRDIVRRLHTGETVIEKYDVATICFIDIVSFTTMSGRMKAHEVMEMLQILFREFDQLTEKHNCFNAETIGDAYITVSGGPEGNDATAGAANIAAFALDAVDAVKKLEFQDGKKIKIRVGVASGPVVAGVIGTVNVPKFTLFGETTSRAEEMEKTSLPLQVQCSEETMKLLRSNFRTNNSFQCKRRGKEDNIEEKTWWIVRPSEGKRSESDVLDYIRTASPSDISTVNSMTVTQSRTSMGTEGNGETSMGTEGNVESMSTTTGKDATYARSVRSSLTMASGQAEVRSERGSAFDFENCLMSDNNQENKGTKESSVKTRMRAACSSINIPLRSIWRMFSVAASNKRILFGTFLTFAILCGVGLAILFIFANEYEKDKYQYATNVAQKADRWLDKEIAKALLPLFAMSELVKVVGKWFDMPFKIEGTPQYDKGTSVFNNVTGICDDPAYVDPFVDIASSIKQSSGMQKILVNVQLAPIGVLCLTYPKNNTEDFPPGVYLDTSGAIGLNLFDTPNRAASSKAAVKKQEKTIQGPIKLAQGNQSVVDEALIARYPVFVGGHEMIIDGQNYPFWGLTIVLMDWDKMKTKFGLYNFFSRAYMEFQMTRYDSWNDRLVVIANSSNHEILNDENSISYELETSDDAWTLVVGFDDGFSPPWLGWGTACVIIGSVLLSLLVMMVLATTKMNKMLLYRMMPREAIIAVEQGKTFVERDSEATIFFSHLIGFQKMSGEMSSKDFLLMLTQLYTEFDKLALKYNCTKIETIGAYYIVKGPGPDLCGHGEREGVARIALFALDAIDFVRNYQYKGVQFQIRAGFATGPVVSGVIGSGGLPKYTVFGDTVNFSSRMESTSAPMMIQCPHRTFKLLRNSPEFIFDLEEREEEGQVGVYVKGKGQTMTFWLKGCTRRGADDGDDGMRVDFDQEEAKQDFIQVGKEVYDCVPGDFDLDIEAMDSHIRDKRVSFKE